MKKHAYLILASGNLEILFYNLKIINDIRNDIFIHLDIKNNNFDDLKLFIKNNINKSNVFFLERTDLRWGDYSLVNCEIKLLKEATSQYEYNYYHLISESDMLIKDNSYIFDFFEKFDGMEYIDYKEMPISNFWKSRFRCINLFRRNQKCNNYFKNFLVKIINKSFLFIQVLLRIDITKKYNKKIMYGSQWFSITDSFAKYIVTNEDLIYKMFKNGSCVDEHFIQTLAFNSKFKSRISKEGNLRMILWNKNTNSPCILKKNDFENINKSQCIFARKFNVDVDLDIVKRIYKKIQKRN